MKSLDLVERSPGLTYRKLDNWCRFGVFGDIHSAPPDSHREFDDEDLHVAQVLGRVSAAFDRWSQGRGGSLPLTLYHAIAVEVREGAPVARVQISDGIVLTVDLVQVLA